MLLTDSFLDYLLYERNYSKGTVRYYQADILELQKFGEELLGDLTPSDVDAGLIRIINIFCEKEWLRRIRYRK